MLFLNRYFILQGLIFMLEAGVENSNSGEDIKAETLRILEEAKRIRANLGSDEAQKEYDEVRFATIGALKDLQTETHQDLENIRSELGNSIDPYTYSHGEINEQELGSIAREFNDLQQLSRQQEASNEEEINTDLLNTITTTNAEIIAGGDARFNTEIDTFKDRYWYLATARQISDADYDTIIAELDGLKSSSGNIHTKLFKLSQVIYSANGRIDALGKSMISAWYGSNFEETHNLATRDLIRKVIENGDETLAIGFGEGGYYTKNTPDLDNSLEVGTYLCSLNKNGKLNKENLLQPNGPFSPTDLFNLIKEYKNGTFGGSEIQGLFVGYLDGFEENMELIAQEYFKEENEGEKLIAFANAQIYGGADIIPLYDEEDIPKLTESTSDIDLSSLEDPSLKEAIISERARRIGEQLKEQVKSLYQGGPDVFDIIDAIIEFSINAEQGDDIGFNYDGINETIAQYNRENKTDYPPFGKKLQDQIRQVFDKDSLERSYTDSISSIDDISSEIKELYEERKSLYQQIRDFERFGEYRVASELGERVEEIDRKLGILRDRREELLSITNQIDFDNITELEKLHFDFNDPSVVDSFLENRENVKYISNINDLLTFIEKSPSRINLHEIHPELQIDIRVLRALGNITEYDIYRFPDEFFTFNSDGQSDYGKVFILLNNMSGSYDVVINKFIKTQGTQEQKADLAEILYHIIEDTSGNLSDTKKSNIKSAFFRQTEIVVLLSSEQQYKLGYVHQEFEENNDNAREIFLNVTEKMFSPAYATLDRPFKKDDIQIVLNYLSVHGFLEVKSQFLRLIKNESLIPTYRLSGVLSDMDYNEDNIQIILAGIKSSRGGDIIKPLNSAFKSNTAIIEATLNNTPKEDWAEILPYINATSSSGLLAIYRAGGNSIDEVVNYLDFNRFGSSKLQELIEDTPEKNLALMGEIIQKYNRDIIIKKGIIGRNIKEVNENIETKNSSESIRTFLEQYSDKISDIDDFITKLKNAKGIDESVATIIAEAFNHNENEIKKFMEGLLQASIQEKQEELRTQGKIEFEEPISDKLRELLEENEDGNPEIGGGEKLSQAFQVFLQKNTFENFENAKSEFLVSIGVSINTSNYNTLDTWLSTSSESVTLQELTKNTGELAKAIANEDWETVRVIQTNIENSYLRGEILYLPPKTTPSDSGEDANTDKDSPNSSTNQLSTVEERIGGSYEAPTLTSGDSTIPISREEAKMLRTNPEAEKNLVNMYEFFKKLNLLGVWEYREELITAVGEVTINLEDDSLAEDELLRFGKKLLNLIQKIQEEENPDEPSTINTNITSLDSLNLELSKFSGSRDLWGDDRSFNTYGDDRFEAWMRNYGIIGGITFHTGKVREMMKK